jgi:hypothetical protein
MERIVSVGDVVHSARLGQGVVVAIDEDSRWPIEIKFDLLENLVYGVDCNMISLGIHEPETITEKGTDNDTL